jgi:uncharacterized protein
MKMLASTLFGAILMVVGWTAENANAEPAGYDQDQKVVYHNDGGSPDNAAYFKRMLHTIRNHLEALRKEHVEIRVVNHGGGVELFQLANTDTDLASRLDGLREVGVRFLVCANTLKERQIDWRGLHGVKQDDIVPSGAAELARLQGMGFVYIHL